MDSKDIKHGEYTWLFEKSDLEQGAYYISDPNKNKVAAIFPSDKNLPIDVGGNALLHTKNFKSEEWKQHINSSLEEAMTKGNEHVHNYRVQYQADYTLRQVKGELTKEEKMEEYNNSMREQLRVQSKGRSNDNDRGR